MENNNSELNETNINQKLMEMDIEKVAELILSLTNRQAFGILNNIKSVKKGAQLFRIWGVETTSILLSFINVEQSVKILQEMSEEERTQILTAMQQEDANIIKQAMSFKNKEEKPKTKKTTKRNKPS